MKLATRGQVLPVVMISMVVITLIVFGLVQWLQNDSKWAVKQQKSTSAINLAEAGIDRGMWKLQSSTGTWDTAYGGVVIPGYNFDTTYTDVPGGTYRIKFIAGTNDQITIWAEGRDPLKRETRSVKEVVKNQTIYSAMMSGGNILWSKGLVVFWGPIIAQGNIVLQDDVVGSMYYPRKYAKGTVIGTATYPRDVNGLTPPNTDNVEWWSSYSGAPNVPVLDFATLRSSAIASGTLNIYGCKNSSFYGAAGATANQGSIAGSAPWDLRPSCTLHTGDATAHNQHFGASAQYVQAYLDPAKDYVWYWDNDVTLTGKTSDCATCSTGLRGTVVVRGTLNIDSDGNMQYTGNVPPNAYKEENKLLQNTFDTAAVAEYPADTGLHSSATTFNFGTDHFAVPGLGGGAIYSTTVGVKGFTYVGGNLNIYWYLDFNGAVWVNGTTSAANGGPTTSCGIFYDDNLQVPALNVILLRQSWTEVTPSPITWP